MEKKVPGMCVKGLQRCIFNCHTTGPRLTAGTPSFSQKVPYAPEFAEMSPYQLVVAFC